MSRLDDLGEILDSYEGRREQKEEEISLTPEMIKKAIDEIEIEFWRSDPTFASGIADKIKGFDKTTKEAISKAYYASLFAHVGNPKMQASAVALYCGELAACVLDTPENTLNFAKKYIQELEASQ